MKAPSPLLILLMSLSCIYRGFIAFYPSLRGENRKNRKPIPKTHGIGYFLVGLLCFIYSLYVIYIFVGGTLRILPIDDKTLFRSADMFLLVPFALALVRLILSKIFIDKNNDSAN